IFRSLTLQSHVSPPFRRYALWPAGNPRQAWDVIDQIKRPCLREADQPMKRTNHYNKCGIFIFVALTCGLAGAHANTNDEYYDLVRPNGHARNDAAFQADLDSCYGQTGASRYRQDTSAFKQCMLGRK